MVPQGVQTVDYQRYSVLVIEDQPFVRKTVVQLLRQMGFTRIAEAEDGSSGLAQCIAFQPDMIVCDIEMRPMNGMDFLTALRASTAVKNPRAPVIFLTKHTESEIVRQAMERGVNAFVVKPPTLSALKERIDLYLAQKP